MQKKSLQNWGMIMGTSLLVGLLMVAFSNQIQAEEEEEEKYKFADGVSVTGIFDFREGTEVIEFEVFKQMGGFSIADETPEFELTRIVGNTPLLHKATDLAQKYRVNQFGVDYPMKYFDVEIILSQDGLPVRAFSYHDCTVTDYQVDTLFDKEEGWMGKGFAITDTIEFLCDGYQPQNVTYEYLMDAKKERADTISSLDLK